MTYDWNAIKDEAYQLAVVEKKTMDEIVRFFNTERNFPASKRAFHHKFARWKFPGKYNRPCRNEALINRVGELWRQNINGPEQLAVLRAEGYEVSKHQIRRLRLQKGFSFRARGPVLEGPDSVTPGNEASTRDEEADDDEDEDDEDEDDEDGDGAVAAGASTQGQQLSASRITQSMLPEDWKLISEQNLTPEDRAMREQRQRELEYNSMELWATKKRRRRTRGYGSLPADPPGPPRYPSEMTLEESKAQLQLNQDVYTAMRETFTRICQEEGIAKKTVAGPERWEAMKEQLIRESMHLRAVMWDPENASTKKLAIDIICCDVTKRIRSASTAMSLVEARRTLNIDPDQGRSLRIAMVQILADDKFVSKIEAGKEHWDELKARWIAGSPLLSSLLAGGDMDPAYGQKMRAVDVIARDASRRFVDRSGKKIQARVVALEKAASRKVLTDAKRQARAAEKAAEKEARQAAAAEAAGAKKRTEAEAAARQTARTALPLAPAPAPVNNNPVNDNSPGKRGRRRKYPDYVYNMPKLPPPFDSSEHTTAKLVPIVDLTAAGDSSVDSLPDANMDSPMDSPIDSPMDADAAINAQLNSYTETQSPLANQPFGQGFASSSQTQPYDSQPAPAPAVSVPPPPAPPATTTSTPAEPILMAVYFRLHPASSTAPIALPPTWIAMLDSRSLDGLRAVATEKAPRGMCVSVTGIVKDGKGGEVPLQITDDEELGTYLQCVTGAPTFTVHIVQAC